MEDRRKASTDVRRGPEPPMLTVVVPCYNEEQTLERCIDRVLQLEDRGIPLEILIVDDASTDRSAAIAQALEARLPQVRVLRHGRNRGKGAALRTGFREARGDFVAVQDADLEYNPLELADLLEPLRAGEADVVYGSRFLGGRPHRVLYFWHSLGNGFLTFVSNMFTDLNLSDMETCYKVFRRDVIQSIEIQEDRFGFEPEITAKIAQRGLRVYEMGISYHGRTYEEGKKIGWRDGVRALYCIFRYNAHRLPLPMQFLIYMFIGGTAAAVNLGAFAVLFRAGLGITPATVSAFVLAAAVNYLLCVAILFRHRARWSSVGEVLVYAGVVAVAGLLDWSATRSLYAGGLPAPAAKAAAAGLGVVFNFLARRYVVFPERRAPAGPAAHGSVGAGGAPEESAGEAATTGA